MEGWIKLHRKLLEWEWFNKSEMVHLFLYLLLKANYKTKQWEGSELQAGQVLISRDKVCSDIGITPQVFRTCIKRLISTNEITTESTNKYTLVTICNYSDYQDNKKDTNQQNDQQNNQQSTNEQPANNQQITSIKKDKNLSPTYASAHEAELDLSTCFNSLLNSPTWHEPFCMNNRLTPQQFAEFLKQFFSDLQDRGEQTKSEKDAKHHFSSWFKLNKNKNNEADRKLSKTDKARNLYGEYEAIRDGQSPYGGEATLPDL